MTERERLLAILKIPIYPHELVDPVDAVADFLLDHGVKLPVMCRECRYSYCNKYCTNEQWKVDGSAVTIGPDDYCSYGERMESNP